MNSFVAVWVTGDARKVSSLRRTLDRWNTRHFFPVQSADDLSQLISRRKLPRYLEIIRIPRFQVHAKVCKKKKRTGVSAEPKTSQPAICFIEKLFFFSSSSSFGKPWKPQKAAMKLSFDPDLFFTLRNAVSYNVKKRKSARKLMIGIRLKMKLLEAKSALFQQ